MTLFTASFQALLFFTAILSGINISLFVFYFKRRVGMQRSAGVGFLGIAGGFLGVGCSACGSVVLSSIIGIGASSQFVATLPLEGYEFSLLSIGLLVFANLYLAKKIADPMTCSI